MYIVNHTVSCYPFIVIATIPKAGVYSLFIEGDADKIADLDTDWEITYRENSVIITFYHYPYHRRVYITFPTTVPKATLYGYDIVQFPDLDSKVSVIAEFRGRSFDHLKNAMYMLKRITQGRCYHYPISFYLRLAALIRAGRNSRFNIKRLATKYDYLLYQEEYCAK